VLSSAVEHSAYNGDAGGSSPSVPTIGICVRCVFDFYVFFVESFYEVFFFLCLYGIIVDKFLVGWFSLRRVRGILLKCYDRVELEYRGIMRKSKLIEGM
jgi:hypothetical protein